MAAQVSQEQSRVAGVVARQKVEEADAHAKALRAIVTNVQLKDIAKAQVGAE